MKKKVKGFILFELFLSFSLSTVLFFMLYQIYLGVQGTLYYIGTEGIFDIEKNITINNLTADIMELIFPNNTVQFYKKLLSLKNKKNESKKELNQLNDLYSNIKFYFPNLEKTEDTITVSFISKRNLFGSKNEIVKIHYIFKKKNHIIEKKEYYTLFRKETYYDLNHNLIKEGKEHLLISTIVNLSVKFIIPDISKIEEESKQNLNQKDKKSAWNGYLTWIKNKMYTDVDCYELPNEIPNIQKEEGSFLKQIKFIPYTLQISGNIYTKNFSKSKECEIFIDFPITDNCLEIILNENQFFQNKDQEENIKNKPENKVSN